MRAHAWEVSPFRSGAVSGQVFLGGKPVGEVVEVDARVEVPRVEIPWTRSGTMRVQAVNTEWERAVWSYFHPPRAVWE